MIRTNSAKNMIGNPAINHKFAELVATFRQQRGRIASKSEARSFFTEEVGGMEARQDSPTGCYHVTNQQINRSEILLSQISQWVEVMNNPIKPQDQTIAELKLLFFFASEEALNVFLALHSQYLKQQETLNHQE